MKEKLTTTLGMEFFKATKHNELWKNDTHILIWNKITGVAKIKPLEPPIYNN